MSIAQQLLTAVFPANATGHASMRVATPVANAIKVYINDFKMIIPAGPPPNFVRFAFNGGLTAKDLNISQSFIVFPQWDAVTLNVHQSWSYPGLCFAESPGQEIKVEALDFNLFNEFNVVIPWTTLGVRFTVAYIGTQQSKLGLAYTNPNLPTPNPAITQSSYPNWAGTLAPPY